MFQSTTLPCTPFTSSKLNNVIIATDCNTVMTLIRLQAVDFKTQGNAINTNTALFNLKQHCIEEGVAKLYLTSLVNA